MTIEDYKITSGLSYSDIGNALHMSKTTINKAVKMPWRTSWETFSMIANYVEMPEEEAKEQWKKENIEYQTKRFS